MAKTTVSGVNASFLSNFLVSLEETEQSANGYGELQEAKIVTQDDGVVITAVYKDGGWEVSIT